MHMMYYLYISRALVQCGSNWCVLHGSEDKMSDVTPPSRYKGTDLGKRLGFQFIITALITEPIGVIGQLVNYRSCSESPH